MKDFEPSSLANVIQNLEAMAFLESFLYDVAVESAAPVSNMVTISSLGTTFTGTSASESTRKALEKVNSSIPYISTKDVGYEADSINYASGLNIPEGSSDFKIAPAGSVLICLEGGSAGKKMAITNRPIAFGNKLLALVPRVGVSPEYVFSLYKSTSFKVQFQNSMHGVIGGISQKKFLKIQVHDLNSDQQNQMLVQLEDLLGKAKSITNLLATKAQLARDLSRTYKNRIQSESETVQLSELIDALKLISIDKDALRDFQRAVTSLALRGCIEIPGVQPHKWQQGTLGDFFEMAYGKAMPSHSRESKGKVPVYGSNGIVGYHNESLIDVPAIVIGRKGSSGAINQSTGPSWVTDVAYYVIPSSNFDLVFTRIFLESLGLDQLGRGVKPGLGRNDAYRIPVTIPPLSEQVILVKLLTELEEKVGQLIELVDRRNELQIEATRSIINGAFAGLVAAD